MTRNQDLEIKWKWQSAPDIKAAELRATWARLEIYVDSHCLTWVEDTKSGESRRSIFCPLYPLAEWITYNWWFLKAHSRPSSIMSGLSPGARPAPDARLWRQRHNLRGAGDGFRWPNLCILPDGATTRLIWQADEPGPADHMIQFLTSGEASIESDALQRRLSAFVEDVIARLAEEGIHGTPLEDEWSALQRTTDDEAAFCLAAARLGLDPYAEADKYESEILRAAQELDSQLFDDFMDVVQPEKIATALDWVAAARQDLNQLVGGDADRLTALRSELGFDARLARLRPWEKGWRQARTVRDVLGIDLEEPFEPQDFVRTITRSVPPRGLQALGGQRPGRSAAVVIGDRQQTNTKRFTLARSLWHLLWQSEGPFLVTGAYTDRQKIERAFAAELLAPADGIARLVSTEFMSIAPDEREIEEVARKYQVSTMIVQHQIENQVLRAA